MKKTVSFLILLTLFSGCFSTDCENETIIVENNNTVENNITVVKESKYLQGVAIDGYVEGAEVKIGSYKTVTDENGSWSLEIPNDVNLSGEIIEISGGIDSDTGDDFEGVLKTPFENFDNEIVSTPLSTLVSTLVDQDVSIEMAYQRVGEMVGVDPINLKKNHFKMLDENISDGLEISKNSILLQKGVEIISENLMGDNFDFELFQKGFAKAVLNDENLSIEDLLREPEDILTQIGATPEGFENFEASKESISFIADEVGKIDFIDGKESQFAIREQAKAIDLMSENFEKFIRDENEDNLSIEDIKKNIIILGGVEGLVEKLDFDDKNSEISDSFFSKDIVLENVESYNIFEDLGLEDYQIRELNEYPLSTLDLEEADIETISDEVQKIKDRFPEIPKTDGFLETPELTENTFYTDS